MVGSKQQPIDLLDTYLFKKPDVFTIAAVDDNRCVSIPQHVGVARTLPAKDIWEIVRIWLAKSCFRAFGQNNCVENEAEEQSVLKSETHLASTLC